MATNYPDVIPMIAYEDGPKAMDWLSSAFGFKERARMLGKDGRLSHGEMQAGEGVIMLATPTPDYQAPRHHREACEPAQKWSAVPYIVDGVLVYVDDVDAHFAQAKQRGAAIISAVEADQYGRRYRAEDLEGHRWMFMQREREVARPQSQEVFDRIARRSRVDLGEPAAELIKRERAATRRGLWRSGYYSPSQT